jgi:hypothetical protein
MLAREPEDPEALKRVAGGLLQRGKRTESSELWRKLAGVEGQANPHREEAMYQVVRFKRWDARAKEDREALLPEMRTLADTLHGQWRVRALRLLADCLEEVERPEEAAETWDTIGEATENRHYAGYARRKADSLRARQLLKPGSPAPDFSAVTTEGVEIELSRHRGAVVVLVFEGIWGLQRDASLAVHVDQALGKKGAVVVDIVWGGSREDAARAAGRAKPAFAVVPDCPSEGEKGLFDLFGVEQGGHYLYVIDARGNVACSGDANQLEEMLKVTEGLLEAEARTE